MAKKSKKKFRAVTAVKSLARERVGMPPPTRRDPYRKEKEKHKPPLEKLIQEED